MASSGVQAFERHLKEFTALTETSIQREMVEETAKIYQTVIRSSINAIAPGGKMRNVGKSGARVGVKRTITSGHSAIVQATGPLHLLERDTKAHDIPRTLGSRRLRTAAGRLSQKRESTGKVLSGRKILVINGDFVMGPVHHPGTKGRHPFDNGVAAAGPAAEIAAATIFAKSLKSVFRG